MIEPITNESITKTTRKRAIEKWTYPFRIIGYTCAYEYYKIRCLFANTRQRVSFKLEMHKYLCALPKRWRKLV
jgi:hypothetical protein